MGVSEVTWGLVTQIGPTLVRMSGDTSDQPIALKNDDLALATNDKVMLARAGGSAGSGWIIVCVISPLTPVLSFPDSASYATTPDSAALSFAGDHSVVWHGKVQADSATHTIISKWSTDGANRSWRWQRNTDGTVLVQTDANGVSGGAPTWTSTNSLIPNNTETWLGYTYDLDDGSTQTVVKFWTSSDGATWSLDETLTDATGNRTIFDSNAPTIINGFYTAAQPGQDGFDSSVVYRVRVYDGLGAYTAPGQGTLIADCTPEIMATGGDDGLGNAWAFAAGAKVEKV